MRQFEIPVGDIRLAFYEYHRERENSIFFIHGNSTSSNYWRKQVSSHLLNNFRLVCIDLPNHGNSSTLQQSDKYSLPLIADTLVPAIKQLAGNKPYIICGSSLGCNIVAEMLTNDLPIKGLVMAGPCIIGEGYGLDRLVLPGADASAVFAENIPHEMIEKYAAEASLSTDRDDRKIFLADYYKVKGNFRSALYASIAAGNYNDEVKQLQNSGVPIAIIFGADEKILNIKYLNDAPLNLWKQIIHTIPGASHLVNIDAPEDFNELLASFAKDVFTTNDA